MNRINTINLAVQIAILTEQGMRQVDIAKELHVSQATVSRLLPLGKTSVVQARAAQKAYKDAQLRWSHNTPDEPKKSDWIEEEGE